MNLHRRELMHLGIAGIGALSSPAFSKFMFAKGFTHGVASGEPSSHSALLWTRFVSPNDEKLRCEISSDLNFTRILAGAEIVAAAENDHCAKVMVDGLPSNSWLYYRFVSPNGELSPIGRTRTLPEGDIDRFCIGLFSCSNLPFGWFNAYAHAATRDDLDLIIHAGDYLYEYPAGVYPDSKQALAGRDLAPANELLTRADYRLRYAAYRADPDLQRLHQLYPMIAQWDDHEIANDAWMDGAENHNSDKEGDWHIRRAAAEKAYNEWMPVSGLRFSHYQIGNLATIIRPETRLSGRAKQLELEAAIKGQGDLDRALRDFRDSEWSSFERSMLGEEQEKWLSSLLNASVENGTRWQILAQQTVMGELKSPDATLNWLSENTPTFVRERVKLGAAAAKAGLPFNFDAWDGYPAARARLLASAVDADANLVVLSGDSHNAWGNNLEHDGARAAVEFAGQSVTSPGFESFFPQIMPDDISRALRTANSGLAFADTSRRGYMSLDVTPEAITGHWHFTHDVSARSHMLMDTAAMQVRHGHRVLEPA